MTAKLFIEDPYLKTFEARVVEVGEKGIKLDRTAFYALSGGQPGDIGFFQTSNQNIPVTSTVKGEASDEVWHVLAEGHALSQGDMVKGSIDWDLRHRHMRMHTCLHLLCSLIKGDVTGGSIGADKGRLDFNISADAVDKGELDARLNVLIAENHPVITEWITDEDLDANPHLVRTMSVRPPSGAGKVRLVRIGSPENTIDLQPCGGTHVHSTGEIGKVTILKIENKGKQNRRITVTFSGE